MTKTFLVFILRLMSFLLAGPAGASTISSCTTLTEAISCTGALDTPEDVFVEPFTLTSSAGVTVQTYGFGGGTNAAGDSIPSGGFDSLVALFSGTPAAATIVTDGSGNPIASADNLPLFSPGCPRAGTVTVGTIAGVCGDNTLTASLGAGTYTLLLTDANLLPIPVNPGIIGPVDLTDTTSNNFGSSTDTGAYTDLTGGVFQTCVTLTDCNTDTANFAVDITPATPPATVPEPGSLSLVAVAVASVALASTGKPRRNHYPRADNAADGVKFRSIR